MRKCFYCVASVALLALLAASVYAHSHGRSPTVPAAPAVIAPIDEDYSYGSISTAELNLRVPPGAEIWFNGTKVSSAGRLRSFVTPALEQGWDYTYDVRVRWTENGRPVERTRHLTVRAGDRITLNVINATTSGK
jgi:uncharacterized protein (TIGR03000 family)